MTFSSPHSLSPYASVGELNLEEVEKKKIKPCKSRLRLERGKKKLTYSRNNFKKSSKEELNDPFKILSYLVSVYKVCSE